MSFPATLLQIDEIEFEDWAVRGISMSLEPIANGELARDCNGDLVDLTLESHRKYAIGIQCTDNDAPVFTDVWPGKEITITCVPGLGVENTTEGVLVLTCLVTGWHTNRDEYPCDSAWELNAEQV